MIKRSVIINYLNFMAKLMEVASSGLLNGPVDFKLEKKFKLEQILALAYKSALATLATGRLFGSEFLFLKETLVESDFARLGGEEFEWLGKAVIDDELFNTDTEGLDVNDLQAVGRIAGGLFDLIEHVGMSTLSDHHGSISRENSDENWYVGLPTSDMLGKRPTVPSRNENSNVDLPESDMLAKRPATPSRSEDNQDLQDGKSEHAKPGFYFELESPPGTKQGQVRGQQVRRNGNVDLVFKYDMPTAATIATLSGNALDSARQQNADLHVVVLPRGFDYRTPNWRQKAEFRDGKLVEALRFQLTAGNAPVERSGADILFSRNGSPLYEFFLPIEIVTAFDVEEMPPQRSTEHFDLDALLAARDREKRDAELVLQNQGNTLMVYYSDKRGNQIFKALPTMTLTGLANCLTKIQERLTPVATDIVWSAIDDPGDLPTPKNKATLVDFNERVATAGYVLYHTLSQDEVLQQILGWIESLESGCRISIKTNSAFLPWEILYSKAFDREFPTNRKILEPVEPPRFWGYRFTIECLLFGNGNVPVEAHCSGSSFVSFNLDPTIDDGFEQSVYKPIGEQTKVANDMKRGQIGVDLRTTSDEIKEMLQAEAYPATLIYLFCHGQSDRPFQPDQTERLQLAKGVFIDPNFLAKSKPFQFGPIVFLNSCSSGAFSPISFSNFLSAFREKNAVGLLTTSFPVPATFAAAFGLEVINQYLTKRDVILGDLLRNLRRKLLDEGNPCGLFYSLQCPMELRAHTDIQEKAA